MSAEYSGVRPDRQDNLAAGAVDGDVVARPPDAVVPLGHEDVAAANAGQQAHRLVVRLCRGAARRIEAAYSETGKTTEAIS